MKKIIFIFALGFLLFTVDNVASAAKSEGQYLTRSEIEELNVELKQLVEEANSKLANGEENIVVSSENLKLGFQQKKLKHSPFNSEQLNSGMSVTASSVGSKSFQAYIINTKGANFTHALSGTFSWKGSYLSGVIADETLTGTMYSRSASTSIRGVDGSIGSTAKIARITSNGTFTPLKYLPFPTYTKIIVDVMAPTKEYRIISAYIY